MSVQIVTADYVGWAPYLCQVSSTDAVPHNVVLKNRNPAQGGQVVFKRNIADPLTDTLSFTIPAHGSINFFIAGKFDLNSGKGFPSTQDKDCIISVVDSASNTEIVSK